MTPKEFFQQVEGYKWRRKQAERDRVEVAWMTAMLTRAKQIPTLTRLQHPQIAVKNPKQAKSDYEDIKKRLGE